MSPEIQEKYSRNKDNRARQSPPLLCEKVYPATAGASEMVKVQELDLPTPFCPVSSRTSKRVTPTKTHPGAGFFKIFFRITNPPIYVKAGWIREWRKAKKKVCRGAINHAPTGNKPRIQLYFYECHPGRSEGSGG
jgi:hypothetical protein